MLAILGLIPTILTSLTGLGNTASSISRDIRDLQIAKEQTKSNKELKEIDADLQVKLAQKDVLVAEAGSRINSLIRAGFGIAVLSYVFKYFAIDKVLGSLVGCAINASQWHCGIFRTDPLNESMAVVLSACIGFYFLHDTFKRK